MTDTQLLDITKKLIQHESTADNKKELKNAYNVILDMLQSSGKDITIEQFKSNGFPSLLAYSGPHRPDKFRIILNGHVDVVAGKPESFTMQQKDGKLYGRGVYDMKAAAVILTSVFCEYVNQVPYPLGLQIVTDEEVGGFNGAGLHIQQGLRTDFAICGECGASPTERTIANEAKGIAWITLGFQGKYAHAGYLWHGENAVMLAADFAQKMLQRYPTPAKPSRTTTVNVSSITTGSNSQNQVPDYATVKLDVRFPAEDPHFRSKQKIAALIKEIDPLATIIDIPIFDAPMYSSPENPLLKSLKAAAEHVEKTPFKLVLHHATGDGRFYGNIGDQVCEFGIAGLGQHADNEHITIEAFKNYRKTMQRFLATTIITEAAHATTAALSDVQPKASQPPYLA